MKNLLIKKNNRILISIDKKYFRPAEVDNLRGNFNKAKRELKWTPKTSFKNLVKMMIESDLENVKNLK